MPRVQALDDVSDVSYRGLKSAALILGNSKIQRVVSRPVEEVAMTEVSAEYRRRMLEETNRAYAALQATPQEWAAEVSEREAWDATLQDGLGGLAPPKAEGGLVTAGD